MPRGEKNKLTEEQRAEILASYGKESGYQVAKRFGVSHTMVYKIWKKEVSTKKQPNLIDSQLVQRFFELFKDVSHLIPDKKRSEFTENLNDLEKQRTRELAIGGISNE